MLGGCLCGAVRYRVDGPPKAIANCHCSMCRKHSGAAFLTYVAYDKTGFAFERGTPVPFRSSELVVRSHCAACGSPVTFEDTDANTIWVTVGSTDSPNELIPTVNGFIDDKVTWLELDHRVPAWPGPPHIDFDSK